MSPAVLTGPDPAQPHRAKKNMRLSPGETFMSTNPFWRRCPMIMRSHICRHHQGSKYRPNIHVFRVQSSDLCRSLGLVLTNLTPPPQFFKVPVQLDELGSMNQRSSLEPCPSGKGFGYFPTHMLHEQRRARLLNGQKGVPKLSVCQDSNSDSSPEPLVQT